MSYILRPLDGVSGLVALDRRGIEHVPQLGEGFVIIVYRMDVNLL